jgi:preprotein translocase SecE subunit
VRQGAPTGQRNEPQRADLPGSLDHSSGDADEFDAALVKGAGGLAANGLEAEAELDAEVDAEELASERELEAGEQPGSVDSLQEAPAGSGRGGGGGDARSVALQPSGAPLRGGNRAVGFLRASWAELHRVQWPDRRQVTQATAVVLGFVAVAGVYLGVADYVAKEIVEAILT